MTDLYLQAMMRGEIRNDLRKTEIKKQPKNRFEIETEKQIEEYLKILSFEEIEFSQNQLMTPAMKRAQIGAELKEAAKLSELSPYLDLAFKVLNSENSTYLDEERHELMIEDFEKAKKSFNEIDITLIDNENFQTLLGISDSTITSIFDIAVAKFNESQYSESLSLFVLLATLIPENPDLWYRSGILAHKCENYDLALRLYNAAISLDPLLISPRVFSIECYLKSDLQKDAEVAYDEAIKISEETDIDTSWREMLAQLQIIIQAA